MPVHTEDHTFPILLSNLWCQLNVKATQTIQIDCRWCRYCTSIRWRHNSYTTWRWRTRRQKGVARRLTGLVDAGPQLEGRRSRRLGLMIAGPVVSNDWFLERLNDWKRWSPLWWCQLQFLQQHWISNLRHLAPTTVEIFFGGCIFLSWSRCFFCNLESASLKKIIGLQQLKGWESPSFAVRFHQSRLVCEISSMNSTMRIGSYPIIGSSQKTPPAIRRLQ